MNFSFQQFFEYSYTIVVHFLLLLLCIFAQNFLNILGAAPRAETSNLIASFHADSTWFITPISLKYTSGWCWNGIYSYDLSA